MELRPARLAGPTSLHGHLGRRHELPAQGFGLLASHFALLQPDAVVQSQRTLGSDLVLEVAAEAAVVALAVTLLARVGRVVDIGDRIALIAEHEAEDVPW